MTGDHVTEWRSTDLKRLPIKQIRVYRNVSLGHIWSKKWFSVVQQWFSNESGNVTDKLCCNKSEVSWQKLPPFKICWPTWGFLSWSQTTKNAEKLRVTSLSGWHHSGAVCEFYFHGDLLVVGCIYGHGRSLSQGRKIWCAKFPCNDEFFMNPTPSNCLVCRKKTPIDNITADGWPCQS